MVYNEIFGRAVGLGWCLCVLCVHLVAAATTRSGRASSEMSLRARFDDVVSIPLPDDAPGFSTGSAGMVRNAGS